VRLCATTLVAALVATIVGLSTAALLVALIAAALVSLLRECILPEARLRHRQFPKPGPRGILRRLRGSAMQKHRNGQRQCQRAEQSHELPCARELPWA